MNKNYLADNTNLSLQFRKFGGEIMPYIAKNHVTSVARIFQKVLYDF